MNMLVGVDIVNISIGCFLVSTFGTLNLFLEQMKSDEVVYDVNMF